MKTLQFNKYYVTDGINKARVSYSPHIMRSNNKKCITLYEKGYDKSFTDVFDSFEDDTDIMTDYFDTRKVRITEDMKEFSPLLEKVKSWGIVSEEF